jgi:hypothetical protein
VKIIQIDVDVMNVNWTDIPETVTSRHVSLHQYSILLFLFPDRNGTGSETTLKHYLIIALAVICVMIVGAVVVLLLRRPSFCKKEDGRGASGSNHLRGCESDNPAICTSSSPIPAPLDSLPVAMNTGIFVPGGSYDWQECRFQESPLVGTSVFK